MPKLEKSRKILILSVMIILFLSLTGCSKSKEDEKKGIKEKINSEMSYLDGKIITMLNRINNISFSNYKVVSEDVKEEKTGVTNGNEKNTSNQENIMQDTGSASSDSGENDKKSENKSSTSESNSSSNNQSSEDSRR